MSGSAPIQRTENPLTSLAINAKPWPVIRHHGEAPWPGGSAYCLEKSVSAAKSHSIEKGVCRWAIPLWESRSKFIQLQGIPEAVIHAT